MHFKMFLTFGHLDMESFCDELMDAKNLTDKELAYGDKPLDAENGHFWRGGN